MFPSRLLVNPADTDRRGGENDCSHPCVGERRAGPIEIMVTETVAVRCGTIAGHPKPVKPLCNRSGTHVGYRVTGYRVEPLGDGMHGCLWPVKQGLHTLRSPLYGHTAGGGPVLARMTRSTGTMVCASVRSTPSRICCISRRTRWRPMLWKS